MQSKLDTIYQSIVYMEHNLKSSINISDMASYVGFSKFHFSRTFKEVTGFNPYDYYRGRKVTGAIHYMLENGCKIIEAAFEYGFSSPEVFTRACLSSLGMSPSQIKKSLNDFVGIKMLSHEKLIALNVFKDFEATEIRLPALILKGQLIHTTSPDYKLDLENPTLFNWIHANLGEQHTLYILHWPSKTEKNVFHHLIGLQVTDDFDSNAPDFTDEIMKIVPANDYVSFPLIEKEKELTYMRDFIYEYYLPQITQPEPLAFEVQAIRLYEDHKHVRDSILHVPVRRSHKSR